MPPKPDNGNYFAINRRIFRADHPLWKGQEFSQREAWIWIIAEAAYRNTTLRLFNRAIPVKRGQLAVSLRHLATTWRWSKSKAYRYVQRLREAGMIAYTRPSKDALAPLVITVLKYDEYQRAAKQSDLFETADLPPGEKPADDVDERFELWWLKVPRKVKKDGAARAYRRVAKSGKVSLDVLDEKMALYGKIVTDAGVPVEFQLHPTTWLNNGCWNDSESDVRASARRGGRGRRTIGDDAARAAAARAVDRHLDS